MLFDYFLKYINKNDLHGMWIKFRESWATPHFQNYETKILFKLSIF